MITSDPTAQESSFYENLCSEVVPRCQVTICVDITFFHNANVFCYRFSLSAETLASSFRKVTNNDFYVFCEKNLFSLCVWLGMAAAFEFHAHFKTAKFILERVVWISKSCDARTAYGLQTVSLCQVHKTWRPRTKMLLLSPFSEE